MVTSTMFPQMRQDVHLHLDEAIVTTTSLPPISLTSFHAEMGKGVAMDAPRSPR